MSIVETDPRGVDAEAPPLGNALGAVLIRLADELGGAADVLRAGRTAEGLGRLESCLAVWRRVLLTLRAALASGRMGSLAAPAGEWAVRVSAEIETYGDMLGGRSAPGLADMSGGVLAVLAREGASLLIDGCVPAAPAGAALLDPSRWRSNLRLLRQADAALASRVESEGRRLGLDRGGVMTWASLYGATLPDGRVTCLHPGTDPEGDIDRRLGRGSFRDYTGCVLFGFGAGWGVRPVLSRTEPDAWIFVVEPSLEQFCRAVALQDLAPLLQRVRARIHVGDDRRSFQRWLGECFRELYVCDFALVDHPPSVRCRPDFHAFARRVFLDLVHKRRVEMATLDQRGRDFERNAFANVPAVLASRDVSELAGLGRGLPAVVVGAGPSLDDAIPVLREARDRLLIIAVSKALRPLAAAGCPPHVVATLDNLPVTAEFFRNVPGLENILLFFDPDAEPSIARTHPGPRCSYLGGPFYEWARRWLGRRTMFPRGLTVAHQAFFLARHLGADPIALVGVDLAFREGQSHAAGTVHTWGGAVGADSPHAIRLPSVAGGTVLSHAAFRSFAAVFEAEIAETAATVVNCSPFGARLPGAREQTLDAFVRAHATRPLDLASLRERGPVGGPAPAAGFARALESLRGEIEDVIQTGEAGLRAVQEAVTLDPASPADAETAAAATGRVNALNRRLHDALQFEILTGRIIGRVAVRNYRLEKEAARLPLGSKERFRLDLGRMANFFEGYREAACFLRDALADFDRQRAASGAW